MLPPGSNVLSVRPVEQQTPEWCWLASAQMIFVYYGIPPVNGISYQCGIVGAIEGPGSICFTDCAACVFGSGGDQQSAYALELYPAILQQYFFRSQRIPQITATLFERPLVQSEIADQISNGKPVELGITPSGPFQGQAGHDVVLMGFGQTASDFILVVADPFPYDSMGYPNPYLLSGGSEIQPLEYAIDYGAMVSNLQWSASITVVSTSGQNLRKNVRKIHAKGLPPTFLTINGVSRFAN